MKIYINICLFILTYTSVIVGQVSKKQNNLENLINKVVPISLPYTDSYKYDREVMYLNNNQKKELLKKGFKFLEKHNKAYIALLGSLKINDDYKYLIIDVESISQGDFLDEFLVILSKDKITEQFLIYNDGDELEYHYEVKVDKTIRINTIAIEKKEKLVVDKYNPNSPKERFYCKVVETDYRIDKGKVIKVKENTPTYDYFIFNGENLEKQMGSN